MRSRLVLVAVAALLVAAPGRLAAQEGPREPKAESKTPAPPGEAQRLEDLERKLAEQQKLLEVLLREREQQAIKGKGAPAPAGAPAPKVDVKPTAERPPTDAQFQWGYDESFFLKAKINDADFSIRPRAGIQLDYRAFPHSKPNDQFVLRRARLGFEGNFGVFGFNVQVQPLRGQNIPFVDCFLEYRQFEAFKLRAGHFKAPFSLDTGMTGDFTTDTIERPMVLGSAGNGVAPDFRAGAMTFGSLGEGLFQYFLAATNQPDSSSVTSSEPLVTARLQSDFEGFSLGVAGFWERFTSDTKSFPLFTPGQFQLFVPVNVRGWTQAYEVDVSFYTGPLWARAEYVYGNQQRTKVLADGSDGTAFVTQGAYLTLGWLFWGPSFDEKKPIGVPFRDWALFNMDAVKRKNKRNVGAELVARLEWVRADDAHGGRDFVGGVPAVSSTAVDAAKVRGVEAFAVTGGLNLNLIENVSLQLDYVRLRIGDKARAERAHSRWADEILLRAQLDF